MGADYSLSLMVGLTFLGIFALMSFFIWLGWLLKRPPKRCPSPYTGNPLRSASDLSYSSKVKVAQFFQKIHEYDNRMFKFSRAAVCRDTGRIFPQAKTWTGKIHVDWKFLQKRYPGHFVSWGSLDREHQQIIREAHSTLEGFQTQYSSQNPAPRQIERRYSYAKPGPLYVDPNTKVLLGWKQIPDSELEVLIVQKPHRPKLF